jgi:hypothetical protein
MWDKNQKISLLKTRKFSGADDKAKSEEQDYPEEPEKIVKWDFSKSDSLYSEKESEEIMGYF